MLDAFEAYLVLILAEEIEVRTLDENDPLVIEDVADRVLSVMWSERVGTVEIT